MLALELRLSAAAAAGVALLAAGWRLRDLRREYALALQGCGAGIVYLTAFAAVNYYAIVGAGAGLGVTEWSGATPWYHCGTLWLGVYFVWWEVLWLSERSVPSTWSYSAAALVPACVVWALARFGARLQWPVQRFREVYLGAGQLPLVIGAAAWVLAGSFLSGDPRPLDYVPLLNPVEIVQAISLLALFQWCSNDDVDASDEFRWRTLGFLGWVFRRKWNTESGGSGTAIPEEVEQRIREVEHGIRRKWNSDSGGSGTAVPEVVNARR